MVMKVGKKLDYIKEGLNLHVSVDINKVKVDNLISEGEKRVLRSKHKEKEECAFNKQGLNCMYTNMRSIMNKNK